MLVVPNSAEIIVLNYLVNIETPTDPILHLYTNSVTIDDDTVLADFTESTHPGYAAITLPGTNWTIVQNAGATSAVYSDQTFNLTTSATLNGYYITDGINRLLWAEEFASTFTLPVGGGQIVVGPKIGAD